MQIYEVTLNGRQYAMLEKMLCTYRASQLAANQLINGHELFYDMMHDICAPVTDGWCTYEIVLEESHDKLDFLRFMTRQVFVDDEDYFVKQIGKSFHCRKDFSFKIDLKF
ncbi:MAG: hypothetical protein K2O91_20175 [Lachnospiraceae bacterium]|nr:hypothetical protein [Lachnospiraceae bacterium]